MKAIICGGRAYHLTTEDLAFLAQLHAQHVFTEIITGDASGADTDAVVWARTCGLLVHLFFANWAKHGRAAGPIRNAQMLAYLQESADTEACMVVAFPGGRGTADMTTQARRAGIPVCEPPATHKEPAHGPD